MGERCQPTIAFRMMQKIWNSNYTSEADVFQLVLALSAQRMELIVNGRTLSAHDSLQNDAEDLQFKLHFGSWCFPARISFISSTHETHCKWAIVVSLR